MTQRTTSLRECGICGGVTVAALSVNDIDICDCETCGHRQANLEVDAEHVDTVYSDQYFIGGGAGYEDYDSEADMLRERGRKYGRILASHQAPSTLLDVGAAAGYLMEGFAAEGWSCTGVEPNDTMAASGRARGLDLRTGSVENLLRSRATSASANQITGFDAVSMIQVIAHVGDPVSVLEGVRQLLRPSGLLLVETWDRASKTARLFGKRWHEYSPPSVVHWFSRNELDRVSDQLGFDRVDTGRFPKWITAAHGRQLVEHRMGEQHVAAKAARVIPAGLRVPYPGDDLFWSLYRRR
jgi:2-polyprenyl-3-methyl-5-hydroxy-6-metoxy-1,4-benzoquinol methylase